jgi:cytochrome c oxidase subunit I+III
LYLAGSHPHWWRVAAPQGGLISGVVLLTTAAALAWGARPALARLPYGSGISAALMALSACCLVAALVVDVLDWWNAGLRGDASAQGASIFAMLAWHGVIVLAVALSALYYLARWVRGLVPAPVNKTLEALRLLFIYAALEGGAALLLPRLVPWSGS